MKEEYKSKRGLSFPTKDEGLFAIVYTITYRFSHGGGNTLMFIRWMIVKTRSLSLIDG